MIFALLLITATFRPAAPTVGDPIAIEFQQPVVLDFSPAYEIVSQQGRRVVVRTFQPRPFAISGRTGDVRFGNMTVPVRSVLKPKDDLQPAPLQPPRPVPYPRLPFQAIGVAAFLAAASWTAAYVLARRIKTRVAAATPVSPADRFRSAVSDLVQRKVPGRWAALADATRLFLASLSPHLGVELTTAQLLPRLDREAAPVVAQILSLGDLEKFSPWGAPPADFEKIAAAALDLIPPPPPAEEEDAA